MELTIAEFTEPEWQKKWVLTLDRCSYAILSGAQMYESSSHVVCRFHSIHKICNFIMQL